MLEITVGDEYFDEDEGKFFLNNPYRLQLEHSLVSLSKWEEIWEKPFLTEGNKEPEEFLSYIKCMILNPNLPPDVLDKLTQEDVDKIVKYIDGKKTATWFTDTRQPKKSTQTITSELIYYWMNCYQIEFEPANTWYLNRLFTLIRIHNSQNPANKTKRMSSAEAAAQRHALNEKRLAELGIPG